MKLTVTFILTLTLATAYGQNVKLQSLLDSAKTLFKSENGLYQEEFDRFDYNKIVNLLEEALEVDPDNAEARYYLGYAYSRINSRDGRSMIDMNLNMLLKTSEQFEKVIQLTPRYNGEIIVLDPYSKLSAEWGSMAMSYWHNNKPDSAIWAFREGKRRGGFGDYILELNRKVLDACAKNSILISEGDNFTIPLWYLQIVEGYRKDVSVIDINLLNTIWYPEYLLKNNTVSFDLPGDELDTINFIRCSDSLININNFSWTIKPSYQDHYLLRGDRVLLSLLKQNNFRREIYFTKRFDDMLRLSLTQYLTSLVVVDKLSVDQVKEQSFSDYYESIGKMLKLSRYVNINSPDELLMLDSFRYDLLKHVKALIILNERKKADKLMKLLDKYADGNKFPYQIENGEKFMEYLKHML